MTDQAIMELFCQRDETAISKADQKYGRGCRKIALSILGNAEDAEETMNDMWLRVWNAIPPAQPENLFAFLSASVRNCALNRIEAGKAQKRGGGETPCALEELAFCVASGESVEEALDYHLLRAAIERFLDGLPADARTIFVERYTNLKPITEIAEEFCISESKVKVSLLRTRKKLKAFLKKEGFV